MNPSSGSAVPGGLDHGKSQGKPESAEKGATFTVFLDLPDPAERELCASCLVQAGLRAVDAPDAFPIGSDDAVDISEGEVFDTALRAAGADFAFVDAAHWLRLRDLLPQPPRSYLVVVLVPNDLEKDAAKFLESGTFDYILRDGENWAISAAGYFRALAALRRRFTGAFGALEQRYENLVHALPDIIYELDSESRFTFINNSVRLIGYDPADLIGKHFSVLLHEEDAAAVDRESVLQLFSGVRTGPALSPKLFNERRCVERCTENLEVRLRRSPNAPQTEDVIVTVLSYGEVTAAGEYARRDGSGAFMGSVGIIRDITLRRKSEAMLRKLYQAVDQLSAGVLVADRDFLVEYVNPAFFRISSLDPQEVIGAELFSFFELAPARVEELRSLVRDGFDARDETRLRANRRVPERPRTLFGQEGPSAGVWTALHASPVCSPNGSVTHAIVICEDISQRKAMEELVSLAREEAERANRAKSDFLASMSHELKSPVASILAAARLIEMSSPEPERRAGAIIQSAQGLLDVLGDILDFVRFETGSANVRKYFFPVGGFVLRSSEPFRAEAEEKGLIFEIGPLPGDTIRSDPDRLGRALSALIANAVSFTAKGRVRVEAAVERRSGNVPHLVLTVVDTGEGIPVEDQARIFQPFVQLASPYTKKGGAGIGLSLARNIVRALGGEIRLQSEAGRGSVFTILVPVGEPEAPPAAETRATDGTAPSAEGQSPPKRCFRLLVVDDNEVNLDYMSAILSNYGHLVDTATSGAEALGMLEKRPPDAAILDIQMPGMSGIELGRKIRGYIGDRFDPQLPIVALTAFDPEEVGRSGIDFDAVFSKPMDVAQLLASLDEAVDRRESADPAAFRERWAGRGSDSASSLDKAESELPGLFGELRHAVGSGDPEATRTIARYISFHFSRLGAERSDATLRRLVRALPEEDSSVALCRLERIVRSWDRLRASLREGGPGGSGRAEV